MNSFIHSILRNNSFSASFRTDSNPESSVLVNVVRVVNGKPDAEDELRDFSCSKAYARKYWRLLVSKGLKRVK